MRRVILLIIFFLIPFYVFPQHTLVLKSGEKFNGQLTDFKKSKLKFLFKGNIMTFNENDVISIIFDSTFNDQLISKDDAIIKGVVTYYFNKNYGFKPDIGANVYIINSKDLGYIDTLSIINFIRAKLLRTTISLLLKSGREAKLDFDELSKINAETEDKFKALDNKTNDAVLSIQNNEKTINLSVDGNGTFSKSLKPGDYSVLIISKNRTDINRTELLGKIDFKNIRVIKNAEEVVNAEFMQY